MNTNSIYLHAWLDHWRENYYQPAISKSSYELNEYHVRSIKRYFPDKPLSQITPLDCQKFLNLLYGEGYAKATINKYLATLRMAFVRAETDNLMEKNPLVNLIMPKAPTKKVSALTQKEQVAIETYCKDTLYGDFILFLLYTGLRVGEMIALQWNDFDKNNKTIFIRKSKTESGIREIPLVRTAFDIIMKQPKSDRDNFIFHNIHGNQISYTCMKKCCEKIREKSGYKNFTLHVCRHTFATRLTERGANPKGIAGALGHKKVEYALNIYTDLEIKTLKQDVLLLDGNPTPPSASPIETALAICVNFIRQQCGDNLPPEIQSIFQQVSLNI